MFSTPALIPTILIVLAATMAVIIAVLVAAAAAFLARADHTSWPTAITRAGIAFASTLSLLALAAKALTDLL